MSPTQTAAIKNCIGGTMQSIPAGRGEGSSVVPTGMGGAGMKCLKDKLVHVGFSENPLVAQIWGGFPRSHDGKAPPSFVLPIFGWQFLLSEWGKWLVLLVSGKSPFEILPCSSDRQADNHTDTQHRDTIYWDTRRLHLCHNILALPAGTHRLNDGLALYSQPVTFFQFLCTGPPTMTEFRKCDPGLRSPCGPP